MTTRNGGSVVRVLLAAASAVRRAGLEALIKKCHELKLAGSLHGTRTFVQHAQQLQPDVILVDFDHAEGEGFESLANHVPVVALIEDPSADWIARALRSEVKAILPRDADIGDILPAVQAAYAGLVLLDPEIAQRMISRIPVSGNRDFSASEELTPREIEVLRMLADGLGNREMAIRLGISEHTVKFHISSILAKLGAGSRTEAVTLGIRLGVIVL